MDVFTKRKWVTGLTVVLVLINLLALGTIWMQQQTVNNLSHEMDRKVKRHKFQSMQERLTETLKLSEEQQKQFEALWEKKHEQEDAMRERLFGMHDSLATRLRADDPDQEALEQLAYRLGKVEGDLRMIGINHFFNMRELCTEDQKKKLQEVFKEIQKHRGPPPHLRHPPHGRRHGPHHGPPPGGPPPPPPGL